jgi:hypothetical protein
MRRTSDDRHRRSGETRPPLDGGAEEGGHFGGPMGAIELVAMWSKNGAVYEGGVTGKSAEAFFCFEGRAR